MRKVVVVISGPKDTHCWSDKFKNPEIVETFQAFGKKNKEAEEKIKREAEFLVDEPWFPGTFSDLSNFLCWLQENVSIKAERGDFGVEIWVRGKKKGSARVRASFSYILFWLAKLWPKFKGGEK